MCHWSPEKEARKLRQKKLSEEIIPEVFPIMMNTINPQIQEVQGKPSPRNMKKAKSRHIKTNIKNKNKNSREEKRHLFGVTHIQTMSTFSSETVEKRRQCMDIWKEKKVDEPRLLSQMKISMKN